MRVSAKALHLLAAMALAVLISSQVRAQTAVNCSNPVSQLEMTYCAEQDWLEADAAFADHINNTVTRANRALGVMIRTLQSC
ncbi:MAG: hypothetical protein AAGF82_21395, partial [Pseudomonadota bacterium]